jgi:prolyl-tRNA synthetase
MYAEKMGMNYTDRDGSKKPVWFGSYGIGSTRVLGTLVEVSHDEKGIIWFPQVAPFDVHLIEIRAGEREGERAGEIYQKLTDAGVEVLYDDREISAGEKFTDADLIGIPVRLVVSDKTGDKIELKERSKPETLLLDIEEVIKRLKDSIIQNP